jgi:two-component system, response regulator PdtaR
MATDTVATPETRSLRVVVAEDEADMRDYYNLALPRLGHKVVGLCRDGHELIETCRTTQPDLVIADIAMPGIDGIAAAEAVASERAVPVILVSAHADADLIQRAQQDCVMAYLVKPITEPDLTTSITIAMMRFEQFRTLARETENLKQALADRKVIERAKGILMQTCDLNEAEAFRRLQKLSWDRNRKMADLARTIIEAAEIAGQTSKQSP